MTAAVEIALQHAPRPRGPSGLLQAVRRTPPSTPAPRRCSRGGGRGAAASTPWLAAALSGPGELAFETDRARWLGRGRSPARPAGLEAGAQLSGTLGSVLDPLFALQRRVEIAPGEELELALRLAAADTREGAGGLVGEGAGPEALETVFAWAALAERARLGRLGLDEARAEALQELAGAMIYGHPALRADAALLRRARGPLRRLDRLGVRRDAALAVVPPGCEGDAALAREVEQAEVYWRALGLPVEVWKLRPSELAAEDQDLLLAFASVVWDAPLDVLAGRLARGGAAPEAREAAAGIASAPPAAPARRRRARKRSAAEGRKPRPATSGSRPPATASSAARTSS